MAITAAGTLSVNAMSVPAGTVAPQGPYVTIAGAIVSIGQPAMGLAPTIMPAVASASRSVLPAGTGLDVVPTQTVAADGVVCGTQLLKVRSAACVAGAAWAVLVPPAMRPNAATMPTASPRRRSSVGDRPVRRPGLGLSGR